MIEATLDVSTQVAEAATELGASAASAAESVRATVTVTSEALATVDRLETTSGEIQDAVDLINRVAAQTRLLALNATIEAARRSAQRTAPSSPSSSTARRLGSRLTRRKNPARVTNTASVIGTRLPWGWATTR